MLRYWLSGSEHHEAIALQVLPLPELTAFELDKLEIVKTELLKDIKAGEDFAAKQTS